MKPIILFLVIFSSISATAQEDKEFNPPALKEEKILRPVLQQATNESAGEKAPLPPAYIYDTHLPPAGRKKEVEETEKRFYARPVLNLPQANPQEN